MIRIGKIVATHGIKGAVILKHVVGSSQWLKKGHALHVEMQKGSLIPYFVTTVKALSDEEYLAEMEEIEKVESAKRLVTRQVYVDEALLAGHARQSPLLWIGFRMTDTKEGSLGLIEDVMQTGSQWLAKLTYKDAEVLVPLIEQTIKELNVKAKTIKVTLPEGLLDVYLGL